MNIEGLFGLFLGGILAAQRSPFWTTRTALVFSRGSLQSSSVGFSNPIIKVYFAIWRDENVKEWRELGKFN